MLMKKSSVQYYLKYTALAVLLLLLISIYVFEFPYFTNTFDIETMVICCMQLGARLRPHFNILLRKQTILRRAHSE